MSGTKMVVIGRNGDVLEEVDGWGTSKDRERFTNILKTYVDDDDRTGTIHPVVTISHATSAPSITTAFVPPRKDLVKIYSKEITYWCVMLGVSIWSWESSKVFSDDWSSKSVLAIWS